jgi:protein NRD1
VNPDVQAPSETPKSNGAVPAFNGQTNQQPMAQTQAPQDPATLFAAFAGAGQQNAQTNAPPAAPSAFPFQQNMVPPPPPGFVPPPPSGATGQPALPAPPPGMENLASQILQAMSAGSIAPDQAIQVLNALATAQNGGMSMLPPQPSVVAQTPPQVQPVAQNGGQGERYDQNDSRMRDRSRSPDYQRRRSPMRKSPPAVNRRESPTYGVYDPNAGPEGNAQRFERGERGRGRGKQRGGRNDRNEYRQRSPPRRQPSPPRAAYGQSKFIEWDDNLQRDHIKVLSRTLFVGGAGGTEGEIRSIFARFGRVQTCIVNQDKRHAFVKMLTRPDAVAAKEGMDTLQDPVAQSKARQVRMYLLLMRDTTNDRRPDGVLDLALAIAVTTRRVLVSFLLLDLPTLIASGL